MPNKEDQKPAAAGPEIPASFSSLLLNLSAAALAYLGHPLVPGQQQPEVNLPLAKHTIDTLDILKAKTQNNLTQEEAQLLDDLLYQLKLAYLAKEQAAAPKPKT